MEPLLNPPVDLVVNLATARTSATEAPAVSNSHTKAVGKSIVVVNLPERVVAKRTRALVRDLRDQLTADSPCVVLDMSDVKEVDHEGFDLLLECFEETLKRDGVIWVRGMSAEAATFLELTGMDQVLDYLPENEASEEYTPAPAWIQAEVRQSLAA